MTSEKVFSIFGMIVAGLIAVYMLLYLVIVLVGTLGDVPRSPDNAGNYRFFWECRGENRKDSPWFPPFVARATDETYCGEKP